MSKNKKVMTKTKSNTKLDFVVKSFIINRYFNIYLVNKILNFSFIQKVQIDFKQAFKELNKKIIKLKRQTIKYSFINIKKNFLKNLGKSDD